MLDCGYDDTPVQVTAWLSGRCCARPHQTCCALTARGILPAFSSSYFHCSTAASSSTRSSLYYYIDSRIAHSTSESLHIPRLTQLKVTGK